MYIIQDATLIEASGKESPTACCAEELREAVHSGGATMIPNYQDIMTSITCKQLFGIKIVIQIPLRMDARVRYAGIDFPVEVRRN